jgi:hypothetical protein
MFQFLIKCFTKALSEIHDAIYLGSNEGHDVIYIANKKVKQSCPCA